jgi:altronate dehydratase
VRWRAARCLLDNTQRVLWDRGVSSTAVPFLSVARLPAPTDNVAIAIQRLDSGLHLTGGGVDCVLSHTVLEGHRFAVRPIAVGDALQSWGLPFGRAVRPIHAGDYVANASMLRALRERSVTASLPVEANFSDEIRPFVLEESSFVPAPPVERAAEARHFLGYRRPGGRGVGTRNTVVILGTSSRTAAAARQVAARLQPLLRLFPGIDAIVPIAHTEGGGPEEPNNRREILRALAGFMVHPNVAAVLAIDHGVEPIRNAVLQSFLREFHYPIDAVPHDFLTLQGSIETSLQVAERIVRAWLPEAAACARTREPASELRVALQCGGSDAFSGVSGNPLAGAIVHEVIRQGGAANLCETDELIGAESYIVSRSKDLATARALLATIAAFNERLSWHGLTAEANPSAGNKFRGLYNIVLKSLGAAHKKDPRTRIEEVIGYGEPIRVPGFHFMDSPGNDLEGIAGQVASGCNLFLFVTGNGSITNFPFVPTLKITTTTTRHTLLEREMDLNAGRYLDGEAMDDLAAAGFDLVLATASGQRSKGELAGHSQVSLWRHWRQRDTSRLAEIKARPIPDGRARLQADQGSEQRRARMSAQVPTVDAYTTSAGRLATERVGLVVPTSLCSTQIARLSAERVTAEQAGRESGFSRVTALVHTEGCGFGGEEVARTLLRTYLGYAQHPNVAGALLLEHGCEKVPNDTVRNHFVAEGVDPTRFGWASVQLDGGIEKAVQCVAQWFAGVPISASPSSHPTPITALSFGVMTAGPLGQAQAALGWELIRNAIDAGGTVVIPASDSLLQTEAARAALGATGATPSLLAGQVPLTPGLHVAETETPDWAENISALGSAGVNALVTLVSEHPRSGHPFIPVFQFAAESERGRIAPEEVDGFVDGVTDVDRVWSRIAAGVRGAEPPASRRLGLDHFQLSRGLLGVST